MLRNYFGRTGNNACEIPSGKKHSTGLSPFPYPGSIEGRAFLKLMGNGMKKFITIKVGNNGVRDLQQKTVFVIGFS